MDVHKLRRIKTREKNSGKKFFWKPLPSRYPPEKIYPTTWNIFTQKTILLQPGETKSILLGLGFDLVPGGVVVFSLSQALKVSGLSLSNAIESESVENAVITIMNTTREKMTIEENIKLLHCVYINEVI